MNKDAVAMYDPQTLDQVIQRLKEHRPALGDDVVDTAVGVIHHQLAHQETSQTITQQRRLVSILFVDVVSSTKTFEKLDPEDVLTIMDESLRLFGDAVVRQGGMVARLFGDALLAFFGVPSSHENDAERAIRAALEIIEIAQAQNEKLTQIYPIPKFDVRVGINTGLVALGDVGGAGMEYTAMGDAINIAKHVESAAPHGKLLISHDTYRHVEGAFDVEFAEKLRFKGREGLTQTYIVHRAKPRGFRAIKRDIEGIEIPLIGREQAMQTLQDIYHLAADQDQTHLIILEGNAGVGKSRLLSEFDIWVEGHPKTVYYLRGSGMMQMENTPYSLFYDMFSLLLDLHDTDSTADLRAKVEAELGQYIELPKAHILMEGIGFDFTDSPYVKEALASGDSIQALCVDYLVELFAATCNCDLAGQTLPGYDRQVTLLLIEDLHWADPASLELLQILVPRTSHIPLLFVAGTRPSFFQRNPDWLDEKTGLVRIILKPLNVADSTLMVQTMLQKLNPIPPQLVKQIVKSADGNPFYMEEIIKMMVEEEIIIKGEDHWWLEEAKYKNMKVPATLTGILQSRLDKLPPTEKLLLQRAAVVGHVFWDMAIGEIAAENEIRIGAPPEFMQALQQHEIIVSHPDSAFDGSHEYSFKSAIVREVVYDTILRRQRNQYHIQIAEWLEAHSGDRHNEYVGLIAEHYVAAGDIDRALQYLDEAAILSISISDGRSAIRHLERFMRLLPPDDLNRRIGAILQLAEAHIKTGNLMAAEKYLQEELDLIHQLNNPAKTAQALTKMANIYINRGEYEPAHACLEEALIHARQSDDPLHLGMVLRWLGAVEEKHSEYEASLGHYNEALRIFESCGESNQQAETLRKMGIVARLKGDFKNSRLHLEEGLKIAEHPHIRADIWHSLGELACFQQDYELALGYYDRALELAKVHNNEEMLAVIDLNRGHVFRARDDFGAAMESYYSAMEKAKLMGLRPVKIHALAGMAGIKAKQGQTQTALEWLGMVENHPATDGRIRNTTEIILADLQNALSNEDIQTGLARGKSQELEALVQERLALKDVELGTVL